MRDWSDDRNMSAIQNKQIVQSICAEMEKGNNQPFLDALADEVRWTITGATAWSKTYDGKKSVLADLLGPLRAQFANQYSATASRVIAEDDLVVVERRGSVNTKAGKAYNNEYCFIYRMASGKILEITEYLDTALVNSVLLPPQT
jgi:ketosteroid isomerase-like protein